MEKEIIKLTTKVCEQIAAENMLLKEMLVTAGVCCKNCDFCGFCKFTYNKEVTDSVCTKFHEKGQRKVKRVEFKKDS